MPAAGRLFILEAQVILVADEVSLTDLFVPKQTLLHLSVLINGEQVNQTHQEVTNLRILRYKLIAFLKCYRLARC
jgi:hypothetical protein